MGEKILVLGTGIVFEDAKDACATMQNVEACESIELSAADNFNFELPDLAAYPAGEWTAFVALDGRGLNMSRTQLVAALKARGYKLYRLVAPSAVVGGNVTMGENVFIGAGAIIGRNTKLGLNAFVGSGARVAEDCKLGNSAYVDSGAVVRRNAEIGDYVTVGFGAVVEEKAKVGRYSDLRRAITYRGEIPDRTFYLDIFENPVSIISPV